MITVKELIEILQGLDPNAYVVKPGHSDTSETYDDIYREDLVRLLTIKKQEKPDWSGRYKKTQVLEPGGFWAYCV
jgi:hydroxymethylpyrimidine/phosphomethylpyrimidine kinase